MHAHTCTCSHWHIIYIILKTLSSSKIRHRKTCQGWKNYYGILNTSYNKSIAFNILNNETCAFNFSRQTKFWGNKNRGLVDGQILLTSWPSVKSFFSLERLSKSPSCFDRSDSIGTSRGITSLAYLQQREWGSTVQCSAVQCSAVQCSTVYTNKINHITSNILSLFSSYLWTFVYPGPFLCLESV